MFEVPLIGPPSPTVVRAPSESMELLAFEEPASDTSAEVRLVSSSCEPVFGLNDLPFQVLSWDGSKDLFFWWSTVGVSSVSSFLTFSMRCLARLPSRSYMGSSRNKQSEKEVRS
jgi:hypothetical protein